jgi:hypothetical protein
MQLAVYDLVRALFAPIAFLTPRRQVDRTQWALCLSTGTNQAVDFCDPKPPSVELLGYASARIE